MGLTEHVIVEESPKMNNDLAESLANQCSDSLEKPSRKPESKDSLISAHRLLASYLSNVDKNTCDPSRSEEDSSDSDEHEAETGERFEHWNESKILQKIEEGIKKIQKKREAKAKAEMRSQVMKKWESKTLRVHWPGFAYFMQNNPAKLLVLHGRPKYYSEYAKEILAQPDLRSKTVDAYEEATPDVLSDIPNERVYVMCRGGNSKYLEAIIEQDGHIMHWPFKRLHYYDTSIRKAYHHLKKIKGIARVEQDSEPLGGEDFDIDSTIKDFEGLLTVVDHDLAPLWKKFAKAGDECQKVRFEELWLVFRPGDICFAPVSKTLRVKMKAKSNPVLKDIAAQSFSAAIPQRYQETWRVLCTSGGRPEMNPGHNSDGTELRINPFRIRCYYIDFDGTKFFPVIHDFEISPFEDEMYITSLSICPSRFVTGGGDIEADFRKSGEIFRDLTRFKSFYYSETTAIGHPCGCKSEKLDEQVPEVIESQVVVDFSEALRTNREWRTDPDWTHLKPLPHYPNETMIPLTLEFHKTKNSTAKVMVSSGFTWADDNDYEVDETLMENFISSNRFLRRFKDDLNTAFEDLDDNDLVLLPPRVFGFVLRSRKFASLKVRCLEPIARDDDGFDRLKLPPGHKRMVQSLVLHHMNEMNARSKEGEIYEYDIVRGKGKGLIVLLHGAPGVGKTSTAECVANASGKPLFPVTCGDLGVEASQVEKELEQKFHLAQRWNCVLLLDEADVFLTQRSRSDINHNSLVSVFLRVLEYYTGILFLTTNRVGAFDMAFKSRIHISLYYPPLQHKQTLDIWKMNLDALEKRKKDSLSIARTEILEFAKRHYVSMKKKDMQWNGRQIRNAVQTAVALAEYEYFNERKKRERQGGEGAQPASKPCELLPRHLETVACAAEEFDNHLIEIFGAGEDQRAFNRMDRAKKGGAINPFKERYEYDYAPPKQSYRRRGYTGRDSPSYTLRQTRARSNNMADAERYYDDQEDDFEEDEENYDQEIEQEEEEEEAQQYYATLRGSSRGPPRARGGRGGRYLPIPESAQRRRPVSPRLDAQGDAHEGEDDPYILNHG